MPLSTQIIRNGKALQLRWGNFHIAAMALASLFDSDQHDSVITDPSTVYDVDPAMFKCYPDAPFPVTRQIAFMLTDYGALSRTPLNYGAYTLTKKHKFIDGADGEVLELFPGDVLRATRNLWSGWFDDHLRLDSRNHTSRFLDRISNQPHHERKTMMVTKQQAMSASTFHEEHEHGAKIYRWRRNGATQTWKTRPDEFRTPIKYGIRSYGQLTETNADQFHTEGDCPDLKEKS